MAILYSIISVVLLIWLLYAVVEIVIGFLQVLYGLALILTGSLMYVAAFLIEQVVRFVAWIRGRK